jgi:hypothetical protein
VEGVGGGFGEDWPRVSMKATAIVAIAAVNWEMLESFILSGWFLLAVKVWIKGSIKKSVV